MLALVFIPIFQRCSENQNLKIRNTKNNNMSKRPAVTPSSEKLSEGARRGGMRLSGRSPQRPKGESYTQHNKQAGTTSQLQFTTVRPFAFST
jgi:hypothetical protein